MNHIVSLNGCWKCATVTPEGERLDILADVPGTVHMALIKAGVIENLYVGDNAKHYQWIEKCIWEFTREFEVQKAEQNMKICFEGLDVYCDIYVNEVLIGSTDNMFIEHHFSIGCVLKKGKNRIRVVCWPPDDRVKDLPQRAAAFGNWTRVYTRRIQCTYGWDWVERFVTCGIVKNVYLYGEDRTELDHVYVYTNSIDDFGAQIKMNIRFKMVGEQTFLRTIIISPNGELVYENRKLIVENEMYQSIDISNPMLWYPNGYGEQNLYRIIMEIGDKEKTLSQKEIFFGIRTIRILQKQDLPGTEYYEKCLALQDAVSFSTDITDYEKNTEFFGFVVLVNHIPVMCKGANWVPCEAIRFEGNDEKIKRLLSLAKRAGINMIRVWGGGMFEEDVFYDECDRLGILVAQDFLMACGSYPCEQEWFLNHLKKEAVYAGKKLRNHACLAWWNGDNENAAAGSDNQAVYDGRKGVRGVIMPVLHELDYMREVFPSSPYGGDRYASLTSGTTHNTQFIVPKFVDIRMKDMDHYEDYFDIYLSRFNSEEPIMGAPALVSLRKFMTDEEIFGKDTSMWRYHTRNNPCGEFLNYDLFQYLEIIAEKILGSFENPQDRLMKLQYIQYESVRKTMELYRRNKWFSAGIVYWMFNDIWPASGWSLVDYFGIPKAGYYAFAKTSKPVIVTVKHEKEQYCIYVCNDGRENVAGTLNITAENFKGRSHTWTCDFISTANTSCVAMKISENEMSEYTDSKSVLLCELNGDLLCHRTRYYISSPAAVEFPVTEVTVLEETGEEITLQVSDYTPVIRLEGNCVFEDNYFSMNKGEIRRIHFCPLDEEADEKIMVSVWRGHVVRK